MKNPLVDALRQAKAEQPDREPDDPVRLGETPIEGASNDGNEYVDETPDDVLELMQTTTDLVVVDVDVEVDGDSDEDGRAVPDADAAFAEAFELAGQARSHDGETPFAAEPVCHGRPDGLIEHSANWLPLVCVLLLAGAMSAVPAWKSLTSDDGSLGLTVGSFVSPTNSAPAADGAEIASRPPRFAFSSAPARAAPIAPLMAAEAAPQRVEIRVQTGARRPSGVTDLRDDTFSTIAALYGAYLSGDVSRTGFIETLDARVRLRQSGTESELKLLLQQFPDESLLYNALGTLLAEEARWPEAGAAFARAAETAEGAR